LLHTTPAPLDRLLRFEKILRDDHVLCVIVVSKINKHELHYIM
jgi:hypothetical protein